MELCPYYWLAIRKVRVVRWMVSSSSDTLSLWWHMQLTLIKQDCQVSPVDEVNSNPIAYFMVSEERIQSFYVLLKHFQMRTTAPVAPVVLEVSVSLQCQTQPRCKADAPQLCRAPKAVAKCWCSEAFGRLCQWNYSLCCSTVVSLPGPRCKTSYLGFKGCELISCLSPDPSTCGLRQGETPIIHR